MSNSERIGRALDILRHGLVPFVRREMEAKYGSAWTEEALRTLRREQDWQGKGGELLVDVHALLVILWHQWKGVFDQVLGHAERSLVSELREVRNRWAHQQPFNTEDAYRALDSMYRLLTAVSAEEARTLDRMRQEVLRIRFEEMARRETKRAAAAATSGQPLGGLRPWREVVSPHPDVRSGRYQQAEFAADLSQVYRGEGAAEYRDAGEFFRRTFLTEGIRYLLTNALQRLSEAGGDPVVELRTNFGGGKTHSMLALYHIFSGKSPTEMLGVESVLREAGVEQIPYARRAVLVGTAVSPSEVYRKEDGTEVRTLWGELAWQLGGRDGFAMVAGSDAQGVSPGSDTLRQLFTRFGPCLILIDEWIAYWRQMYGVRNLPGGSFESHLTFAQALTEAVKQAPHTLLVASIPASNIEIGGEGGQEALIRLQNTFSRLENSWRPASQEESFEIVRRRLFENLLEPQQFAARDAVVRAFTDMYRTRPQEFPSELRSSSYEERMKAAYPIHPELFDRLYGVWSTLDRFQRTRGVLRLMAAVIHSLWEGMDTNLLIMPGMVPVGDPEVQNELTRYLEDKWTPAIEKDVDGSRSLPLALDGEYDNLGRYAACRRVARTIYMGAAPMDPNKQPGIDEQAVKLGSIQPGESTAVFGDALRRLSDQATYLYVDNNRYWYSTQPSIAHLARERAGRYFEHDVWEEIHKRLQSISGNRGAFVKGVHAAPTGSGEVPDEDNGLRLVILGPETPHFGKAADTPALKAASDILNHRGTSPRYHRNLLVFLAPDRTRLVELEQAVRQFKAWDSIVQEQQMLNLTAFQAGQAVTKKGEAHRTVEARIQESFTWLLVPVEADVAGENTGADSSSSRVTWQEIRVSGPESLPVRSGKKLINDAVLYESFSPDELRMTMDRFLLWRNGNHVPVTQIWTDLASYLYLPKIKDRNLLLEAIRKGVGQLTWQDHFAYADRWDEARKEYVGLKAGQMPQITWDSGGMLVRPEAAERQLAQNQAPAPTPIGGTAQGGGTGGRTVVTVPNPPVGGNPPGTVTTGQRTPHRFHGTVQLSELRMGRDAGKIAEEIVQHLASLPGSHVDVTLEISIRVPDGVPESVVRTVSENCRTLRFVQMGFEEE